MSLADFPQLQKLSDPEKIELIHELWDSMAPPPGTPARDEELAALLEARWQEHLAHPEDALTVEEFKKLMAKQR